MFSRIATIEGPEEEFCTSVEDENENAEMVALEYMGGEEDPDDEIDKLLETYGAIDWDDRGRYGNIIDNDKFRLLEEVEQMNDNWTA